MRQTFQLEKGEISFEEKKIIIIDDKKKQQWLHLILTGVWTAYFAQETWINLQGDVPSDFWLTVLFFFAGPIGFILSLFESSQREIKYDDIKTMKIQKRLGNEVMVIRMKNFRRRVINGIINSPELDEYLQSQINHHIKTS